MLQQPAGRTTPQNITRTKPFYYMDLSRLGKLYSFAARFWKFALLSFSTTLRIIVSVGFIFAILFCGSARPSPPPPPPDDDVPPSYESVVGAFEKAVPLETSFFRESWGELERLVGDADRDAPIMTYCTGGIRCVKVKGVHVRRLCDGRILLSVRALRTLKGFFWIGVCEGGDTTLRERAGLQCSTFHLGRGSAAALVI